MNRLDLRAVEVSVRMTHQCTEMTNSRALLAR